MAGTVEVGIGVTVGIPTYGRLVSMGWANAWKQLNPPINYNIRFGQVNNRLIADARNELAEMAVKNGSRFLLFIGDDVVVPPYTMQKMVFRMENFPNLGVVGGIYCSKSDVPAPLVFRENGRGPYWKWKVGEFFEVTGLGMDCTMIRTDVFRELDPPWFKTINEDDYEEAIANAESWTEDIWFCTRVIEETDWKIYADAGIMCEHWDFARNMKFMLPWDSYPMQRVENPKKMVDLGCGKVVWDFEGEGTPLRVDIREEADPDYRCDLRDLPFANDQFEVAFCMEEGQPILTKSGFKNIEDVSIGDEVWTHKRRWKPVTANRQFPPQDKVYKVVTMGNPQGVVVTKEHPILAKDFPTRHCEAFNKKDYLEISEETAEFIQAPKLSRKSFCVTPVIDYVSDQKYIDLTEFFPESEQTANYLAVMEENAPRVGDKTLAEKFDLPRTTIRAWIYHDKAPFGNYHYPNEIQVHSANPGWTTIPRFLKIDADLMRLAGYYLSNGSLSEFVVKRGTGADSKGYHAIFHFNTDKRKYLEDIRRIIKEKLGLEPTDERPSQNSDKALNMRYSNKLLYDFMRGLFGWDKVRTKRIPEWALWVKPKLQMELIKGFLAGDGHVDKRNRHHMVTVSRDLAEGLRLMLIRNRIFSSLSKYTYERLPKGARFRGCGFRYTLSYTPNRQSEQGGRFLADEDLMVSHVKCIKELESTKSVYGLEVQDDQSYYTSNMMHHNSSHVLEHFGRHEVDQVLNEWIRIVQPGGELRLCVPNMEWAAKNILDGQLGVNELNVFYGSQDYPENFHKFGFTPESLKKMLEDRKMEVVETNLDGFHILIRARKPEKEETEDHSDKEPRGGIQVLDEESSTDAEFEEGSGKADNSYEEGLENPTGDDPTEMQPIPLQLRDTIKIKDPSKILGSGGPKRRNLRGKEI